jgi:hypothetical protein
MRFVLKLYREVDYKGGLLSSYIVFIHPEYSGQYISPNVGGNSNSQKYDYVTNELANMPRFLLKGNKLNQSVLI